LPSSGNRALPSGQELPPAPPPRPAVDVEKAAARLNEIMTSKQRSLRFRVDEGSGRTIITVINKVTHEVIRQIPPEELLALADQLRDLGTLIDVRI
jgi:flagellar protein FlaG